MARLASSARSRAARASASLSRSWRASSSFSKPTRSARSDELRAVASEDHQVEEKEQDQRRHRQPQWHRRDDPSDRKRDQEERDQAVERRRQGDRDRDAGGAPRAQHHRQNGPFERRRAEEDDHRRACHHAAHSGADSQPTDPGSDARPCGRPSQQHRTGQRARHRRLPSSAGPAPGKAGTDMRHHHVADKPGCEQHAHWHTHHLPVEEPQAFGIDHEPRRRGVRCNRAGLQRRCHDDESADHCRICRCIAAWSPLKRVMS